MQQKLLIINTGGTFNKRYNPLNGILEVPTDAYALECILKHAPNLSYELISLIHKDSLDMNDEDRQIIAQAINASSIEKVLIVHGTDTMDLTALYLASHAADKTIILMGAMVPFSIDPIEATTHCMFALGSLCQLHEKGVFIAMHGTVLEHTKISKNRQKGLFEPL